MAERVLSSRRVYEGRVVNLRVDEVELENGRRAAREVVEHRGAVCLLAFDEQERVLLVRQYRSPVEDVLLEAPAGTLNAGEEPEACARRELAEETGFAPGTLERLVSFYSAPGFCTEELHVYVARELRPERLDADEDESIELVRMPFDEAILLAGKGVIRDAKTLVALFGYAARRRGEL